MSAAPHPDVMEPSPARRALLLTVLLAAFSTNLTLTILTIAIAPIATDLGASVGDVAWVTLLPMIVAAIVTPAAGRLADRAGRRLIWFYGLAIATVGMGASGFAPSLAWLLLARVVTGLGTALVLPSGLALVTAAWPRDDASTPIGYWTGTMALSPTIGILVGGVALEWMSWRALFFAQLPLAIVALLIAPRTLPADRASHDERAPFDWGGAVFGAVASLGFMLALSRGPRWGAESWRIWLAIAAGAAGLLLFIRAERSAADPVLPPSLWTNRISRAGLLQRSGVQAMYMGSFLILPILLTRVHGWSPGVIAMVLLPRPLAMAVAGPLAGGLVRRVGERAMIIGGALSVAAAATSFMVLAEEPALPLLILALVAQGAGLAFVATATAAQVTGQSKASDLGATSSAIGLTAAFANAGGMAALLGVLEALGGESVTSAYEKAFGLAALACLGVALSGFRRRK